jgi:hypothetical protein
MTGSPLGVAVKRGYDSTVAWLCSFVCFGVQVASDKARKRQPSVWSSRSISSALLVALSSTSSIIITSEDFDCRPVGYESHKCEGCMYPKPLPIVIAEMESYMKVADPTLRDCTLHLVVPKVYTVSCFLPVVCVFSSVTDKQHCHSWLCCHFLVLA